MTALMAAGLGLLMIGTAFLSGIFGMAGGLILIGVLLFVFPLPTAMVLHAVTQMASNGWRALLWWRHIVVEEHGLLRRRLPRLGRPVVDHALRAGQGDGAAAARPLALHHPRRFPSSILPRSFGPAQVAGDRRRLDDADAADRRHRPAARHHVPALAARAAADHRHQGRLPGVRPRLQAALLRRADRAGRPGRAVVPGHRRRLVDDRHLARQARCSRSSPTRSSASGRTG